MVFSGFGNTGLTATAAQTRQTEDASKKKIYCYHAFAGTVAIYSDPTYQSVNCKKQGHKFTLL